MRKLLSISAVAMLLLSGCRDRPLTRQQVDTLVKRVTKANLPEKATDVHGKTAAFMTTTVDFRFTCTEQQLQAFLKASPQLNDQLQTGKRTVVNTMSGEPWWKPDELDNVRGSEQTWKQGNATAHGLLMAGHANGVDGVVVYVAITIEK